MCIVGSHMCRCRVALVTAGRHAYIGSKVCQDEVLRINQSDERQVNQSDERHANEVECITNLGVRHASPGPI